MKDKKLNKYGILLGLITISVIVVCISKSEKNQETITRYEWVRMLAEQFGLEEHYGESPYYSDVTSENQYYEDIQSAYEWGILDENANFNGEKSATGKFIALTTMKIIGKYKVQIYMELSHEPTEKDYLNLAIEEGIISKSKLNKGITANESQRILELANELYASKFWVDDFLSLQYQDSVKEIEPLELISVSEDNLQLETTEAMADTLEVGNTIVYSHPVTGEKIAKNIRSISQNKFLELEEVTSDQVIQSLMMSDVTSITAQDIISYYHLDGKGISEQANSCSEKLTKLSFSKYEIDYDKSTPGFSISVQAQENEMLLSMTDHSTGILYELPIAMDSTKTSSDVETSINATIEIPNIDVGVQAVSEGGIAPDYMDVRVESNLTCKGEISINTEKKIPLLAAPVYLGNGVVGLNLQLYLVLSVDGSMSIQAEFPARYSISYDKTAGIRRNKESITPKEPVIEVDCTAELDIGIAPSIKILAFDILDVEGDIGVAANANIITRSSSNLTACANISIALPIMTLSVSTNEAIDKLGDLVGMNMSKSWDVITAENAPVKADLHYEWYTDGTSRFVNPCTYQEKAEWKGTVRHNKMDNRVTYYVEFTSDFTDQGDYYEATGKLCCYDFITQDALKQIKTEGTYNFYGHEYIYDKAMIYKELFPENSGYGSIGNDEDKYINDQEVYLFTDKDERTYFVNIEQPMQIDNDEGHVYMIFVYEKHGNMTMKLDAAYSLIDDNYKFKIGKDHVNSSIKQFDKSVQGMTTTVWLYTNGYLKSIGNHISGQNLDEDILHKISMDFEDGDMTTDFKLVELSDDEAITKSFELLMNLTSCVSEEALSYFDSNQDYCFDEKELTELWYWAVDEYNEGDKKTLSDQEKAAIGRDYDQGVFQTPQKVYKVN